MSYKINKYTDKKDFIVEYNHNQGLKIQDGTELVDGIYTEFTYALLPNEKMVIEQVEIEVSDYNEENEIIGKHLETKMLVYPVINPDYEKEQIQKETERIAKLKLTKREVFLALYKDKSITPEQIKSNITNPEHLIEFEYANEYYRGNPLIDSIGTVLGYTKEKLDYLFENKTFDGYEGGDGNA